jgi:hypothetical protein
MICAAQQAKIKSIDATAIILLIIEKSCGRQNIRKAARRK